MPSRRFVVCSPKPRRFGTVLRNETIGNGWRRVACKPGSVHALRRWTTIPLDPASPQGSRGQPGRRGGNAPASVAEATTPAAPIRPCSRWGLPCRPRRRGRGGLLPHPFTLASGWIAPCRGGLLSVALSLGFHPRRPLAGTVFPWSPDFPPARCRHPASGRPATRRRSGCRAPRRAGQRGLRPIARKAGHRRAQPFAAIRARGTERSAACAGVGLAISPSRSSRPCGASSSMPPPARRAATAVAVSGQCASASQRAP
jgi:hypothetical protein